MEGEVSVGHNIDSSCSVVQRMARAPDLMARAPDHPDGTGNELGPSHDVGDTVCGCHAPARRRARQRTLADTRVEHRVQESRPHGERLERAR